MNNEDLIINKLIDHDGRLEHIEDTMATKDDVRSLLDGQDKVIRLLERIDQERTFTNLRMDRFEEKLETMTKS